MTLFIARLADPDVIGTPGGVIVRVGENTAEAARQAARAEVASARAEGFALTLEANASGGYYTSLAEGVADANVAVGEAFNVIENGRHYVARKTAADAGEIVTEYSTTGVLGGLGYRTVEQFGAVGDGTTVDTSAIQSAINAVSAAGGGTVHFGAKAYRTGTLNLPQDVTLRGQGKYATRLVATSGLNAALIRREGSISNIINRGGVEKLTIVGSGKANTGMFGITSVFTNRATYRDIDIFGCYIGVYFSNVWQDTLDNIHVHGGGTDQSYIGFYGGPKDPTTGISNAVIATGCIAQGVEYCGWRLENYDGSKFTSCEGMNGQYGWYLGAPSNGVACQFGHFVNCLGDTNTVNNWRIEKGNASQIVQTQFTGCWAGTTSSGASVYVGGASELQFSNWQIIGGQTHGIHFFQSSRCSVTGGNIRAWNVAAGGNAGVYLQDSLVISIANAQIYTSTLGTGKAVIESGSSNYNTVVGCNTGGGVTLIGGESAQSTNTTA